MSGTVSAASCFLVEWYQTGPAALSADDAAAQLVRAAAEDKHRPPSALLMALTVPDDQTFFGVFSAATAEAVIHTCERAGWTADRISTGVCPWLRHDAT